MLTSDHENIQAFKEARERWDHTAQQVADKEGKSRQYIYEVLKYPNKNPELFKRLCDYIEEVDVEVKRPGILDETED